MNGLENLRGEIDRIDTKISSLLVKRFKIALKILALKKKNMMKVRQPDREKKILGKIKPEFRPIFREIIKQARKIQMVKWR